jgi:ring-1,2-phenylacetyl-CoA epoxidase subunit PaaE
MPRPPLKLARPPLKLDRNTLLLLLVQWLVFVGNIGAAVALSWPVWIHVVVGFLPIHVAFTIWHEAAHGTVANRRFINNAVGVAGMLPYMTPYFIQRNVHLDHHKYLNEPGRDPNEIYAGGPFWQLPLRYLRLAAHARRAVRDDPRTRGQRISDTLFLGVVVGVWGIAIWQGVFTALFFAWLLPMAIAKVVMDWYINYLPHVGLPADRFAGTRIVDVSWLTPLLLGHNYHAVHHLWPTIPWHGYLARFRDRRDYLEEHRVPIEHRVFAARAGAGGV